MDLCRSFHSKREIGENGGLTLSGAGDSVTKEMEKIKVLNAFFTSVKILIEFALRKCRPLRSVEKSDAMKFYAQLGESH